MDFKVTHVGVYRQAQHLKEIRHYTALVFMVGGADVYVEDGVDRVGMVPLFILARQGGIVDMLMNSHRENWVIMLEGPSFHPTASPGTLEVRGGKQAFQMPGFVPVPRELVPGWQNEFELMRLAWLEPTPRNLFRIESGVMNVLRHMADSQVVPERETPAAKLKRLIDGDQGFERSTAELSRQCGYSDDHLRLLFEREFNMPPGQYRARRRLSRAMELMAGSSLGVKEISARLGFGQLPAFSNWFKRAAGATPSEAIAKWRSRA